MEERKFVCKYCSKRFPCGKSLGGHIRTHMNEHSGKDNEEKSNADAVMLDARRKRKKDLWSEAAASPVAAGGGGGTGNAIIYGLRENPKKTTRFVHSDATSLQQQDKFCKECGKAFPSLKALCGHMACHSEKEKGTNKFDNSSSGLCETQKLVMDSQSDTETCAPTHPRRSRRMRFKTFSNHPSSFPLPNNGSSSVSEVEQEQEEVARCLMLLSKDFSHRGRFASVTESSDNNSVVLEAKSPSVDTRIAVNNGKSFVSNAYELVDKKLLKDMKLKSASEIGVFDNSDSGYFRYGPKKVDSDVSNNRFFRNDEFKRLKVGDRPGFEGYDVEYLGKMLNKGRSKNTVFKKLVLEDANNDKRKFDSRKRANYDSLGHNLVGVARKKTANDEIYGNGGKGWKYECLGSKRDKGSYDSTYESYENSTDTDSFPAPKSHKSKAFSGKKSSKAKKNLKSKKSREHECPICYKIFRSGQALGGHKRSHFVGGSEENTLVIKQGAPSVPCLIDLNLPASVDE